MRAPRADADVNHNGMAVFAEEEVIGEVITTALPTDPDVDNRRGYVLPVDVGQIQDTQVVVVDAHQLPGDT